MSRYIRNTEENLPSTVSYRSTKKTATSPAQHGGKSRRKDGQRRIPLSEQAYVEIRRRIMDNKYTIGFQVLEPDLACELGMSRTPIREALIQLKKEGLIEIIPRHGMRVLPIPVKDMLEVFQILTYVEALAVDLIIEKRLSPESFKTLDAAVAAMSLANDANDIEAWSVADQAFHRELLELAGNQRLKETMASFWDQTRRTRRVALFQRTKPLRSTENHKQLLKALCENDVHAAREIHFRQRRTSYTELLEIIDRFDIQHL
jgi:DNA-binding GntR family transcriptional regulator